MYKKCQGPERTADIIVEAINAKNLRASYTTTNDAKMIILMKKLFGERVFDNMIRCVMN
jgi:hypothetical protein